MKPYSFALFIFTAVLFAETASSQTHQGDPPFARADSPVWSQVPDATNNDRTMALAPQTVAQRYYRRSSPSYNQRSSRYGSRYSSSRNTRTTRSSSPTAETAVQEPKVGPGLPNEPQTLPEHEGEEISQLDSSSDLSVDEIETRFDDLPELSEDARNLRRLIENLIKTNARRPFQTRGNSLQEIIQLCFPYGAETLVYHRSEGNQGGYLYAIGCLCWNYPCQGRRLLRSDGTFPIAKMGYGYQNHPSTFLAMLAFSNIDESYEIRLEGSENLTLADLVEGEKYYCSRGDDLSLKLVGLSFYVSPDDQWQNSLDEDWSLERVVHEEVQRPVDQSCEEITNQLLGFSAAVRRFQLEEIPLAGPLAEARDRISQYQDFALQIRNKEGGWHPKFFLYKGTGNDFFDQLFANAHILRWLAFSLPEEKLHDTSFRQSIQHLAHQINRISLKTSPTAMSSRQIEALTVSLHALAIYRDRAFARHRQFEKALSAAKEAEQAEEEQENTETKNQEPAEHALPESVPLEETQKQPSEMEGDSTELPQP